MPKITWNIPQRQKEITEDLRERYGGMMTASDVMRELGFKHDSPVQKWLADVPAVMVNNRRKWRVGDIAKKLYANEC